MRGGVNVTRIYAQSALSLEVEGQASTSEDLTVEGGLTVGGQIVAGSLTKTLTDAEGSINGSTIKSQSIDTSQLATGSVTSTRLDAGAVTNEKIADYAINSSKLATGGVGSDKIADGAVTSDKLASDAVTSAKLATGAVTSGKIGSAAVGNAQIAEGAIDSTKIGASAVGSSAIAQDAVVEAKIADNAVTSGKLATDSVTVAKMADNAVGSAEITDGSIAASDLGTDSVTNAKVADNAIGSAEIVDGSITANDLTTNSVTNVKMADNAVGSAEIADGSIAAADLGTDSVTNVKMADNAVGSAEINDGSIASADLGTNSVTTLKIADASITPAKLDNTLTYSVGKLGIGTASVPPGGYGGALLAIHGTDSDIAGPHIRTTTTADNYAVFDILSYAHDNVGIRFDCWWDGTYQRSSDAGSNATIHKYGDTLQFKYATGVSPNGTFSWTPAMHINLTNGSVLMQQVYSQTVGGTNRALYIDSTGKLGYLPSSIQFKENVRDAAETDTSWIFGLRPVMFDYKDPAMGVHQCGLIAEEVATVNPEIVSYKREVAYGPEALDKNGNPDPSGDRPMTVTITNEPETVNYDKLAVPMLAELQRLRARVQDLEARVATLETLEARVAQLEAQK